MNDKLQTAGYEKFKRRNKVLGWILLPIAIGQTIVRGYCEEEVLEIYKLVMYVVLGLFTAYNMYYMYKYRHEDNNKLKMAIGLLLVAGLIALIVFTERF